jgi:NitT/TauT family transport system substrate-binding protein
MARNAPRVITVLLVALIVTACTASTPASPAPAPAASAPSAATAAQVPERPVDKIPVRIGYGSLTGSNLPLWIAKDQGLLEQYGIEVVEFPLIEGGTLVIQALLAGDLDFALAGSSGLIAAGLRGADPVMIAGASNKFDFALMARPEIRTPADLRGKNVGISRFGSSSDFAARAALQRLGLDPDRDVTILQIGGTNQRIAAMQAGAIDAAPEIAPALLTAQRLGYTLLIDLAETGVPYEVGPMATTRTFINKNREAVRRFVYGYLAGVHRLKTDKAVAMETTKRYIHTDDPEILEATWAHFALHSIPELPYLTETTLAPVLQELAATEPQAANVRLDQFYDNSFLKEAEDNGFVRRLYGR